MSKLRHHTNSSPVKKKERKEREREREREKEERSQGRWHSSAFRRAGTHISERLRGAESQPSDDTGNKYRLIQSARLYNLVQFRVTDNLTLTDPSALGKKSCLQTANESVRRPKFQLLPAGGTRGDRCSPCHQVSLVRLSAENQLIAQESWPAVLGAPSLSLGQRITIKQSAWLSAVFPDGRITALPSQRLWFSERSRCLGPEMKHLQRASNPNRPLASTAGL
ncbi:hypothetical protein EYF80_012937 [Liparis tanakae]|uniref:Uncharacterized protein n=1 Tax=Liparis tanakae TaxID=230148 RepID=A0A4Z2IHF1_9TELE|nr:hypothetical protein EYF80_012937 [Liparis tanakae]